MSDILDKQNSFSLNMVGAGVGSFLGLVTLFFNRSVVNNLDTYVPEYLPASFYFFRNLSDPYPVAKPVENDKIYDNSILFPRCCQPETVYDIDNKGCVPYNNAVSIDEELNITVNLIQSGLIDCMVVIDRYVRKYDLKIEEGNATLEVDGKAFQSGKFCLDNTAQRDDVYVVRLCQELDYCVNVDRNANKEWCVHKCCRDGFQSVDYKCSLNDRMGIHVKNNSHVFERTDGYGMMYGGDVNCKRTIWKEFQEMDMTIKANGVLHIGSNSREYQINDYCLGTNYDTTSGKISDMVFYCEFRKELYVKWILVEIATIITCICFVLTLAVYLFVYRLRKLIQKIIACFCLVDLIFWIMYGLRIFNFIGGIICIPFAYTYFFIMISRLSWLNVLSFEIWRNVGSSEAGVIQVRQTRTKRMVYYTVYALLIPTICTMAFIFGYQEIYSMSERFQPLINKVTCFIDVRGLDRNLGHLYLYIPVSILIIINLSLFIKSTLDYLKRRAALQKISNTNGVKYKKRIAKTGIIILKLALIMGVTWIYYLYAYIVSFQGNETLRHIGDVLGFANIFEGVYFFVIFASPWKTMKFILKRLKTRNPNAFSFRSSSSTVDIAVNNITELSMKTMNPSNN